MRKRDVKWGFLSQVLGVSAGLLLLPVVLHYLSSEDVGLWYVFISLAGLSQLLEIGFKPTISRYVAYVYAGAEKLYADGYEGKFKKGEVNLELLKQLFIASKKISLRVSIASLLLLVVGGFFYIALGRLLTLLKHRFFFEGIIA